MAYYEKKVTDIKERLVAINRITKVVKGGRRFGFAALVVVGNQKGSIGIGQGKSKQVPDAIKKATQDATRNLIKVSLKDGRTLHHDVTGRNGSGKVLLRSAVAGTGIIAGGPIRAVCDVLGIQDIVAKSLGSANPHNVVKASVNALISQKSPKLLSSMRGKKISEIVSKRENTK
jgi:small subunit ribosomal protein S5